MNDLSREVYCLLGLPFDAVTLSDAEAQVRMAAQNRVPCFLSTPNLNFLIGCLDDGEFRESVLESDLSVVDGMPLVWLAGLLGVPLRERVAGSTLFDSLRQTNKQPLSVYFFGGADGVAEVACQRLNSSSSGLSGAGYETPGFGTVTEMSSDETLARINASGADFLVVALGAKKGQAWIMRNRAQLDVPVVSHLGAVVNFVAGTVSRAPGWMQRVGLEWLWRIKEEPGLWRRYFSDGSALLRLLFVRVLPYARYLRKNRPSQAQLEQAQYIQDDLPDITRLLLTGTWGEGNLYRLTPVLSEMVAGGKDLDLDLNKVSYIDSAFIGRLMLVRKELRQQGRRLHVTRPSSAVRQIFFWNCAEYLFEG